MYISSTLEQARKEEKVQECQADGGGVKILKAIEEKTLSSIRSYLSSTIFADVGPVTARRIVQMFGIRTMHVIETSPHELFAVRGVGRKRVESIQRGWTFQRTLLEECAELMQFTSQMSTDSSI